MQYSQRQFLNRAKIAAMLVVIIPTINDAKSKNALAKSLLNRCKLFVSTRAVVRKQGF
jgi:hypothetical protein